jgi:hypothetical protein
MASNFRFYDLAATECARATGPSAVAPETAGTAELRIRHDAVVTTPFLAGDTLSLTVVQLR